MEPKIRLPFKGNYRMSFLFGEAPDWYVKIAGAPHNGIDFAMPDGTPILATDDGAVSYADIIPDGNGLGINITHSWGLSQSWHLEKVIAILGTQVKKGDVIGNSGHSGWATGPHLHFGVKVPDSPFVKINGWVDPLQFFEPVYNNPLPQSPGGRKYLVLPGDSLWKIAKKFYGDGLQWPVIYRANLDKIKDPGLIRPLQALWIP